MLAALCAGVPLAAQEPAASTAVPVGVQSPLMLSFSKDAYSSRVGLDYSIRWDFSDLASFKPGLGLLYSGIKAVTNWDITENTRLDYYGLRTNPWRLIIAREKKRPAPAAAPGGGGLVSAPTPEYRKRVRLSISPLVDEIKRNFDDGLRDFLLRSSLSGLSPEWERAGEAGRRSFVRDVLSLEVWRAPLPVIRETKEGLEYLSEPGKKAAGGPPQPFTISTRPVNGQEDARPSPGAQ
ncbi:MAG: hypothetical protein HY550_07755 [Elusimicrobia bacterium]|nr:hypothetical protein [Elusimicrobiota bacterium]